MRSLFYLATLLVAVVPGTDAQASMGLNCSQWLDARAFVRYDFQSRQLVDERPPDMPAVPQEVIHLMDQAYWYLAGRVATLAQLDYFLRQVAASTTGASLQQASQLDAVSGMTAVDRLCRNALENEHRDYDVADMIDTTMDQALTTRTRAIQDLLNEFLEQGRREGAQQESK